MIKKINNWLNIVCILIVLFPTVCLSQTVKSIPTLATEDINITIIFNSNLGNKGLMNYNGDIYAHTGLITEKSNSGSDWKYTKTKWGENTQETKLTKIGPNQYSLSIGPNVREYYNAPQNEKILKLAFVFRSAQSVGGSYLEGKSATGNDLYIDIFSDELNIYISKPENGYFFPQLDDKIPIDVASINADSIFIFKNNILIAADSGNQYMDTTYADTYGKTIIKAVAKNDSTIVADSFYYYVKQKSIIEPLPKGVIEGINYIDSTTVILCLFAPEKECAFAIGDYCNWEFDSLYQMKQTPDSNYFWLELSNLISGKEYIYQYLVDYDIYIGDPYSEKVSDPWNDHYINHNTYPNILKYPKDKANGIATVFQTNKKNYNWKYNSYKLSSAENLIIYELLIRDFSEKHSFKSVIDSLSYLQKMGINAIELMPVNEFEGNISWGYNPNYYFAVDKYYGHKNDLKSLIDTCHSLGIAIILDVVYNHSFGTSPYVKLWWDNANNRPATNNPFYNTTAKHDFNVGFDFNHESPYTRKYISRILKFWTKEFKIDGYRFDLSKGFTQNNTLGSPDKMSQYDASRIYTLKRYADSIWSVNPEAYVIMEHFADNNEEKELSEKGMMVWGKLNYEYSEAAMGYNNNNKSNFSNISYLNRGWNNAYLVGYMESHDEERLAYKCKTWGNSNDKYNIKEKEIFMQRLSMNAAFFLTIPGPKMIWQFGELGYDYSIDYNGRTGEKPIKWDYINEEDRYNNYLIYAAINKLRADEKDCFNSQDFTLNLSKAQKSIIINDSTMSLVVVGNFDIDKANYTIEIPHNGIWYDYLSGEEIEVKNNSFTFNMDAGEYHILINKEKNIPKTLLQPKPIIKDSIDFEESFIIYPNPTVDDITIFINSGLNTTINLTDINGRILYSKEYKCSGETIIKLSDINLFLNSGVYFINISSSEKSETKKLIIL